VHFFLGGKKLDVKDMRYFVAAYEANNFSVAADVLGTVQSNVSLRIRNLEDFLGVELFQRLHRRVEPTAHGELLYQHAKQVIETLERTAQAIKLYKVA